MDIKINVLHPRAKLPTRQNNLDAGYDLYACESMSIAPMERRIIPVGLSMEIPIGYYGRIAPRSGLACKKGIDVMAGVVDSGYRGEVKVLLINLNFEGYNLQPNAFEAMFGSANKTEIKPGDRIAQLIIEKCHTVEWKAMKTLEESQRGEGGFGSSGQ